MLPVHPEHVLCRDVLMTVKKLSWQLDFERTL